LLCQVYAQIKRWPDVRSLRRVRHGDGRIVSITECGNKTGTMQHNLCSDAFPLAPYSVTWAMYQLLVTHASAGPTTMFFPQEVTTLAFTRPITMGFQYLSKLSSGFSEGVVEECEEETADEAIYKAPD
jgi:hypothetical protein